eukprot:CAMPEP_0171661890 /NCGR_PEP_ID=MMETSP0990-20121206/45200_1 /TAXON_ID=483369 /ORGANISM="non described non described, Strain CCMP2098" /LENGTH=259 /DNA_ID=CAMNT_0012244149 /DNA_START=187 /DNA_END=967 /DNA_ORIENTATION=-
MAMVSLASAMFVSAALVGLPNSDPSRVAATIVSGVGFLGAGVITQPVMVKEDKGSRLSSFNAAGGKKKFSEASVGSFEIRPVYGLTTAAAIWMSAAAGVACAAGLPVFRRHLDFRGGAQVSLEGELLLASGKAPRVRARRVGLVANDASKDDAARAQLAPSASSPPLPAQAPPPKKRLRELLKDPICDVPQQYEEPIVKTAPLNLLPTNRGIMTSEQALAFLEGESMTSPAEKSSFSSRSLRISPNTDKTSRDTDSGMH